MTEIVVKVGGMQCGMCEAHVNDTVRASLPVKKVTSSHTKGETVIITDAEITDDSVKTAIEKAGYEPGEIARKPYEKKGLFSFLRK